MSEEDRNGGGGTRDVLRARADVSRWRLWILLEADRRVVAGGIFGVVFLVLLGVGYFVPAAQVAITAQDSVDTLFQALVTGTITGVTIVLTLNQLVLSQELGAVGDQRERMAGALTFREDVANAIRADVSPARPSQFLRALVDVSGQRARALQDTVGESDDEALQTAVADLTESLVENANRVADTLDDAQFGEFEVVSAALNFNYSWKIFSAERIDGEFDEELDAEQAEALERLRTVLDLFGPAREHFKTLYFQWELITLSRVILVTSIPALLVSLSMIVFFDVPSYVGTVWGISVLPLLMALAISISVLPFIVLLPYVLRIATITRHTLSIGPFILRDTDQVEEVPWGDDRDESDGE
jgi:hypothetical protein